ncbi:MAG TPA: CoA transferase [Dehalococcoidia bacterium]|nr:CoA transferase [Dehalococcoidia bacterium]
MALKPLDGIRVLELADMVSAPYCARLLADYGADVIKLEQPGSGDHSRRLGPFPADQPDPEKSGLYFLLNRGKRSVTLDVSTPAGRDMLLNFVRQADVLVENQRPGQMREWALDYETLATVNPELVMISITPFGQIGPYSEWKGYDLNAFHLTAAGHRYVGKPDQAPLEPGSFIADFHGGVAGATWGLAAVYGRRLAGGGQHIDVACAEVIAAIFTGCQNIGAYAQDGVFERRTGIGMGLGAPATILPCKDGYVWMLALEPGQWKGLSRAMGDPDWMQLDTFQDMFSRAQQRDAIYPLITEWTMEHGKQEIMDVCQENGCPTTAVYTIAEAAEHPHLKERGYVRKAQHAALGTLRTIGPPIRLGDGFDSLEPAPLLGEHNAEVYTSLLGLTEQDIERLRRDRII